MSNILIDKLEIGAVVSLDLYHGAEFRVDTAVFLGVKGEGDDRVARFSSVSYQYDYSGVEKKIISANTYTWEAYRFNKRWCWGSSAGRVSVAAQLVIPGDVAFGRAA